MADPVVDNADFAVDELKRKARRRLVGAIVLALAAATILPLLLEQEQKPLGDDVSVQIPPIDGGKFVSRIKGDTGKDAPPGAKPDGGATRAAGDSGAAAPAPVPAESPAMPPGPAPAVGPHSSATVAVPAPINAESASRPTADAKADTKGAGKPTPKTETKPQPADVAAPARDAKPEPKAAAAKPPATTEPAPSAPAAPANPALSSAATLGSPAPPAPAEPAATPAPAAGAPGPEASRAEGYVVQLGAFTDNYGANALANKLKKAGYPAFTEPVETSRGTLWRVRVGGYPTRQAAVETRNKLKADGQNGVVTAAK